jgi:hypothetical protein
MDFINILVSICLEDIIEILNGKIAPKLRSNLIEGDIGVGKYWVIK